MKRYERLCLGSLEQGKAQAAIGEHAAQSAIFGARLKIDPPRLHLVGHSDGRNGRGKGFERGGNPDILEQVPACGRDCTGAPVKPFGCQLGWVCAVYHMRGETLARSGQRECCADQPAAKNQQIAVSVAACCHLLSRDCEYLSLPLDARG